MWTGIAALLLLAAAQEPQQPAEAGAPAKPVLQNTGAPLRVGFECTEEDIRMAGLSCTERHPCPVYLEIADVEAVGAKIFLTGNIHTSAATLSSILVASEDGGRTWTEPHERVRGAILDQIQFLDFQSGWVAGQMTHPLPRDPFFLLTTNGGKTWRRRPVFDEDRLGAIERFRFDSRDSGTLWIDRSQSGEVDAMYERYESMTGGESWMLREVSTRPIAGPAAPQSEPSWRPRAHAATRSYRIEKREGENWQPVASFLITIGDCKPPERPLPEPAEPELDEPLEAAPSQKREPPKPPSLKKSQ